MQMITKTMMVMVMVMMMMMMMMIAMLLNKEADKILLQPPFSIYTCILSRSQTL